MDVINRWKARLKEKYLMTIDKQILDSLPPVYFPNEINIVKELFLPVSKVSNNFTKNFKLEF